MPVRIAKAQWNGDLQTGNGVLDSQTGAVKGQYSFSSRFEEGIGTNPEELLAAAHAGCFSMALSAGLAKNGFKPVSVATEDKVHIVKGDAGFSITKIEVHCNAKVENITDEEFQKIAAATKEGCPVSRALTGTTFELYATLV